jgi:hypothetical protein
MLIRFKNRQNHIIKSSIFKRYTILMPLPIVIPVLLYK